MKVVAVVLIAVCISSLVMLGKREIATEGLDYIGENINGIIMLNSEDDGYGIYFYPNKAILSQHLSSDSYTFNFYNSRNEIVLNTGLVVFTPNLKEVVSTKLIGVKKRKLEISRVTVRTKNAEYNIEMKKNENTIPKSKTNSQ